MMVDHSETVYLQLQDRRCEAHIRVAEATKLEALAARTYSDDINLCHGALSAPRASFRPGQRDDAVTHPIVEVHPVI